MANTIVKSNARKIKRLKYLTEGKCYECGREPMPNRIRCKRCALRHNTDNQTLRKKYSKDYKCTTCSAPLMPEEIEKGYKKCVEHREHLSAGISQWGRS